MRRSKRTSIHSYNDRTIFATWWEHVLVASQRYVSSNRMQALSFRVEPVLPGLFDRMFSSYPEVIERKVSKRVISHPQLVAAAKDYDLSDFHSEKYVGQGTLGRLDLLKINETRDLKGWTVHLEFSLVSRTRCLALRCKCADFVAQSDDNVYLCDCGHSSFEHTITE